MPYRHTVRPHTYVFEDLKTLLALADAPLRDYLHEALVPHEQDEVRRVGGAGRAPEKPSAGLAGGAVQLAEGQAVAELGG